MKWWWLAVDQLLTGFYSKKRNDKKKFKYLLNENNDNITKLISKVIIFPHV